MPLRLLRTGAFRLALLFALGYALSAFLLVWAVDGAVVRYARHTASLTLLEEVAALREDDRQRGRPALIQEIDARAPGSRAHPFLYRLQGRDGTRLAGGLPAEAAHLGWGTARTPEPAEPGDPSDGPSTAQTYGVRLDDGAMLVVGRETFDVQELNEQLARVTLWSGLGVAALALVASFGVAAVFLRRLDRVNDAIARIAAGGHTERLPPVGMGAEFDRLSGNVNTMLDRIIALMASMRQVSTDVAHDLRTPLTRLRNRLEAARGSGSPQRYEQAIEEALGQADGLLATFRALLRIGMIEGGAGRARFAPVDLGEVMERVRLAYLPAAEDQGLAMPAGLEEGALVMGDAELLAQLFANLVENALVHAVGASSIAMRLERGAGRVRVSVLDDGPGVPEAERDKVLGRFYTLDRSRSSGGAGLGLALVAAIAALHDARLTLADAAPGLRVELDFPAA